MIARKIFRFLVLPLLAGAWLAGAPPGRGAEAPFSFAATPGKLPKAVVPSRYAIHLEPDLQRLTTRGTVEIEVEARAPVDEIVLNALDLEVSGASLVGGGGEERRLECRADAKQQTLTLKQASDPRGQGDGGDREAAAREAAASPSPARLAPGKYRLQLEFTGKIREQPQGLFYVKYPTPSGTKLMLATEMEPTDARRVFPCWDEPVFRAVFELSVVAPEPLRVVSNMPAERETRQPGGLKEVRFAPTPPMASYLVLLVAGELEELAGEAEGVQIRVLTTQGKKELGRYALETAKKLLPYYNRYFGLKYPLPKLDQIAIPGNFDGAMENWGAITYDEASLLYDPRTSSAQTRRDIFVFMAHEISHQWFGNLVTMAWWDNLWLNEGFASWMETKATDALNPSWQMWLAADEAKSTVMSTDARNATHAIQQPVQTESEANAAFDSITYQKGGALLQMLESYVGPEQFRHGLRHYLEAHRYSNATTADLWAALEEVSGKPIRAVARGWTEQPGLPLVSVRTSQTNGQQLVWLEQQRFTVQSPDAPALRWKIPVALLDAAHPAATRSVLLEDKSAAFAFGDAQGPIKANAGDAGYYRVSYAPALFDQLLSQMERLPEADRLNLLDDEWALVEANRASAADFLALVEALELDPTYIIWDKVLSSLTLLDELEQGTPGRAAFQRYARGVLRPQFGRLGWTARAGEPESDALLRSRLVWGLGYFGDEEVIAEAKARFKEMWARPNALPGDLRSAVLRLAGRYGDRQTYEQLRELARRARGTEERQLCYGALAETQDGELARLTLELALSEVAYPQEATALVVKVAAEGGHRELAWEFARQHREALLARVDASTRSLFAPSILGTFSDLAHAVEMENYVRENAPQDAAGRALQAAELIRFKAALKTRELPALAKWLESRPLGVQ